MRGKVAKLIRKYVPTGFREQMKQEWLKTPKNLRPKLREQIKLFK